LGISLFLPLTEKNTPYETFYPRAAVCEIRSLFRYQIRVLLELGTIKTKRLQGDTISPRSLYWHILETPFHKILQKANGLGQDVFVDEG